jgi:hypothetical protein
MDTSRVLHSLYETRVTLLHCGEKIIKSWEKEMGSSRDYFSPERIVAKTQNFD